MKNEKKKLVYSKSSIEYKGDGLRGRLKLNMISCTDGRIFPSENQTFARQRYPKATKSEQTPKFPKMAKRHFRGGGGGKVGRLERAKSVLSYPTALHGDHCLSFLFSPWSQSHYFLSRLNCGSEKRKVLISMRNSLCAWSQKRYSDEKPSRFMELFRLALGEES